MLNTQDVRVRNARVETLRVGAYILANVRSQIHVLSLRVGPRVRTFRVASRVSGQLRFEIVAANVRALRQEPYFEKEPPAICVAVATFRNKSARRCGDNHILKTGRPPSV